MLWCGFVVTRRLLSEVVPRRGGKACVMPDQRGATVVSYRTPSGMFTG